MLCVGRAIKSEENAMFESAQIELPVGGEDQGRSPLSTTDLPEGVSMVSHAMRATHTAAEGNCAGESSRSRFGGTLLHI